MTNRFSIRSKFTSSRSRGHLVLCIRSKAGLIAHSTAALFGSASPAAAALLSQSSTIGQTGHAVNASGTAGGAFQAGVEIVEPADSVPSGGGVITSFQTESPPPSWCSVAGTVDFQVLKPVGNGNYSVVGHTGNENVPCNDAVVSYPVSIRVQAGDLLGVYAVTLWFGNTAYITPSLDSPTDGTYMSEPSVGQTVALPSAGDGYGIDEAAVLQTGPLCDVLPGLPLLGCGGL